MQKHVRCPICKGELRSSASVCKPCPLLEKNNFSFSEQKCEKDNFYQICDLYDSLLLERVYFAHNETAIEVNYVLHKTVVSIDFKKTSRKVLEFNNKLVSLDYPSLKVAKDKINTVLVFS